MCTVLCHCPTRYCTFLLCFIFTFLYEDSQRRNIGILGCAGCLLFLGAPHGYIAVPLAESPTPSSALLEYLLKDWKDVSVDIILAKSMKAWGRVHRTHVNTQVWWYIPVISALGRMILGDCWPVDLPKWVNSRFCDIPHLRTLGRECLKKHLVWTPGLHMHVHAYIATPTSLYAQTHRLWEIHTHLLKFSSTHTL